MRKHLDLFTGLAGFSLALEGISEPVGMVEICKTCREGLKGKYPNVEIQEDIRTAKFPERREKLWLVAGGFPCQDISAAGKGVGLSGTRSGLWSEMRRIIGEQRPAWVLIENVPALRTRGADEVLSDLEGFGYAWWPLVVGARHVGGSQRRDRIWIVAYLQESRSGRLSDSTRWEQSEHVDGRSEGMGDTNRDTIRKQSRWRQREEGELQEIDRGSDTALGNSDSEPQPASEDERGRAMVATEQVVSESARHGVNGGGLADSDRKRCDPIEHERERATEEHTTITYGRWPMPPGREQHDWEEPRVVGHHLNPDWVEQLMGYPKGWSVGGRRHRLEQLGNAVVPQVVACIGRAMLRLDELLQ